MSKKMVLVLSVIVLLIFSLTFFDYINGLTKDIESNKSARMLMANGSFDDVIKIKFYTATAIFIVASTLPMIFVVIIGKQLTQKEPV